MPALVSSRRALLGGGAAAASIYLLEDQFITARIAGAVDGTLAEPGGLGTLSQRTRNVWGTATRLSISGGKFAVATGTGTVGLSYEGGFTRAPGLIVLWKGLLTAASGRFGWASSSSSAVEDGLTMNRVTPQFVIANAATLTGPSVGFDNVELTIAAILRSVGVHVLIADGATWGTYPTMTRLWVGNAGAGATVYPMYASNSDATVGTGDQAIVQQLGAPWNTDFGGVTARVAVPVTGELLATAEADGLHEITWTVATAEVLTILFRRTDDDNCWKLVCDQAGSTIKLYERSAGVDTERDAGKTQIFTNATVYRIVISPRGAVIQTYVNTTIKHNFTSGGFQQTALGLKASGFAAAADLVSWPRTVQLPSPLV